MSDLSAEDLRWLDAAVRYAAPYAGTTAENPAVAALIVEPRTQTLIARGVTARGGRPHAEAEAIAEAGFDAAGCTLYVTLEPCRHWGRTPPCVDAIIRAGIMRVVVGAADPRHAGSAAHLESAGVETTIANHAPSLALHAGHLQRQSSSRPMVTGLVVEVSAIGKIAQDWIGAQRARADAIVVGAATAQTDPDLTVSVPGLAGRTPLRVVLAGATGVDRRMNLIGGFSGYRTAIIAETSAAVDAPVSVETIRVAGRNTRPDLKAAMTALSNKGLQSVLVEPGRRLLTALLDADLLDHFALITTAATIGEGTIPDVAGQVEASGLVEIDRQRLGEDTLIRYARPQQPV